LLNRRPSKHGTGILAWLILLATLSVSCAQRPPAGAAAEPTPQAATPSASPIPWATIQPPAQVGIPAGTPSQTQPRSPVRTFKGVGVIRSINLKEGWFEIDHEEIAGFMSAMQMQWSVKNRAMLKSVNVGDKVNFTVEDDNGSEVITELKKTPSQGNEK
jgi:Cu/Ag efflux protein CusF